MFAELGQVFVHSNVVFVLFKVLPKTQHKLLGVESSSHASRVRFKKARIAKSRKVPRTSRQISSTIRFLINFGSGLKSLICADTSITSCWWVINFLAYITRTMVASIACFLSSSTWPLKVPTPISRKMLEDSPGGHPSVVAASILWSSSDISTRAVFGKPKTSAFYF